ncbi:MAG: DUF1361 domain-containing protein [Streptococcaceae bacterium]|jgi:uncharacterized membrane protein|nr:DUF1361 domain-containing protein [Streptococcaceae bacterium]
MMFKEHKIQLIHGLFIIYSLFALGCFFIFNQGDLFNLSKYEYIPLLMIWNIFLAFIAFDAVQLHLWSGHWVIKCLSAVIAFLFYPNSYYMVTDAKHIGDWFPNPALMDFAQIDSQKLCYFILLMAGVFFGVFLGFETIMPILRRYFVSYLSKSAFVLIMSFLSAVAIYAGRVSSERINSWDVFYRPIYTLGKLFAVVQPSNFSFLMLFTLFQLFIIGLGFAIAWRN